MLGLAASRFNTDNGLRDGEEMQPPESAHRRASSVTSSTASAAEPRRSVGCIAGLLRLLSPYHRSHHRKRLTSKNATPAASPPPPSSPPPKKKPAVAPSPSQEPPQPQPPAVAPSPSQEPPQPQQQPQPPTAVRRRRSCDAQRSPTIAPEHRRASCDSPRPPPPAIVARLMGLEESAPPSPAAAPRPRPTRPPPSPPPETASEKRRKLLGALEKCDEDLKTLRRIIAAVRASEMRAAAASDVSAPTGAGKGAKWMDGRDEQSPSPSPSPPQTQQKPRAEEQYPSPDSVLDAITSPRFPCRKRPSPCTNLDADSKPGCGNAAVGSKIVKPSRTLVFSGDYCKIKPGNELHAVAMYHHPVVAIESIPMWILPPPAESEIWRHRRRWDLKATAGRSRAMVESVEEVWGQGSGEERCEAGRVGAALERAILHDLVGDVVAELLAQSGRATQAPHGGRAMCRKRLFSE